MTASQTNNWSKKVAPKRSGLDPKTATIEECLEAAALLLGGKHMACTMSALERLPNEFDVTIPDPNGIIGKIPNDNGYMRPQELAQHLNACAMRLDTKAAASGTYLGDQSYLDQLSNVQRGVQAKGLLFGRSGNVSRNR